MTVFFNRSEFVEEFNAATAAGYKFQLSDEEGNQENIETAEDFINQAGDYEICALDIKSPNNQHFAIYFTCEYHEYLRNGCIQPYDYSDNEELTELFKNYLLQAA